MATATQLIPTALPSGTTITDETCRALLSVLSGEHKTKRIVILR